MNPTTYLLLLVTLTSFAPVACADSPVSTDDPDGETPVLRVARAQSDTSTTWQWIAGTERQLASEPGSPPVSVLPRAVREAQDAHTRKIEELERLMQQLAELRAGLSAETETNANAERLIREWTEKLARAKTELAELARKEAESMRLLTDDDKAAGLAMGVDAGQRKPILITIRNGFIAPLSLPYFRGRSIRWTDGDSGVEITPVQDGVPLGQALEPGGWLTKKLDEAAPEKNFVSIMVASDSIASYYGLLKELRHRKLCHRWDTWSGTSFYVITQRAPGNATPQAEKSSPIFN